MKVIGLIILSIFSVLGNLKSRDTCQLTIQVKDLENSNGVVRFSLYNKSGTIPDEELKKYYKTGSSVITNQSACYVFSDLPIGKYAVNIVHDENSNGKIDKGFILPVEGIGFSNFQTVGFTNIPNFEKASFDLQENKVIVVKMIYL